MRARRVGVGQNKLRIARGCFVEQTQRLEERSLRIGRVEVAVDQFLGLEVKVERRQVERGALFDIGFFLR